MAAVCAGESRLNSGGGGGVFATGAGRGRANSDFGAGFGAAANLGSGGGAILGAVGFFTTNRAGGWVVARRGFGARRFPEGGISLTELALAAGLRWALKRDRLVVVRAFGISSVLTEACRNCGALAGRDNSFRTLRSTETEPESLLPITVWAFAAKGVIATLVTTITETADFFASGRNLSNLDVIFPTRTCKPNFGVDRTRDRNPQHNLEPLTEQLLW